MSGLTYRDAGVDIDLEEQASMIMYEASRKTWENRRGKIGEIYIPFEDFSGLRGMNVSGLPKGAIQLKSLDGIGTKIEIAERTGKHDTMAYDLLAMLCDDGARRAAEPVWVGSVINVRKLWKGEGKNKVIFLGYVQQLADGMVAAAKEAGVAVINGEIAEVGDRVRGYGDFNYNWEGSVTSFARKDRLLSGLEIEPGDQLVGLKEDGPRSNGISLIRKTLENKYGKKWHEEKFGTKTFGDLALHPSRIYTKAIVDMTGGFDGEPKVEIHAISHVTGGGIPGKLGRILKPNNLGAYIDDTFEPCDLMLHCQEIGNISDEEAHTSWHMGQGMIIVTPEPEDVIKIARNHSIEAKVIGEVEKKPGIRIASKGYHIPNVILEF